MGIIGDWFKKNDCFGLILPNGWFGRPGDNCHQLTWTVEKENKLIIELDNQLYLIFTKPISYSIEGNKFIFSNFRQCVFDWQGYGDMTSHCSVYNSGEVKFASYTNAT